MIRPQASPLSEEERALARGLVIFEDEELMVLDKPPGLASQGGRGGRRTLEDLLVAFARSNGKRPSLVHRLDRDTSGVILAAKTKPMAGFLGKALMGRRVRKTYLAILERAPDPSSGSIEAPLKREEVGREAYMRVCEIGDPKAEAARSRFRTLRTAPLGALVELHPETGRMHQLRVHLAYIGRPIVGDPRYGGALALAGRPASRLMLHAQAIDIPARDGGRRRFEVAPPADFRDLCAAAGLGPTSREAA